MKKNKKNERLRRRKKKNPKEKEICLGMKEVVKVDYVEKKDFEIDWNSVMIVDDDDGGKEDKVPELQIVSTKTQPSTIFSGDQMDSHKTLTDHALKELLERQKSHLVNFGPGLPDKGEKIRLKIASLEEEKQRRASLPSKMVCILIRLLAIFVFCV